MTDTRHASADDHVPAEEALDHLHASDKHPSQAGRSDLTLEEAARSILARSVHIGTGNPSLKPRPGQVTMIGDIVTAMSQPENDGQAAAIGPTGVGKSLVYLSAAAASWAVTGRRSVVSTESLALQAQITDKDAPVVASATADVTGLAPQVAVLKGWSNYACFDGDERFITAEGPRRFRDVVGQTVKVLDGDRRWTDAEIKSFGEQRITRLTVRRGGVQREILTTDDHRWFVNPNANYDNHIETITGDLKPGDRLAYLAPKSKITGRSKPSPVGVCAGLVFGDGSRFRSTDGGMHSGAATIELHGSKNMNLLKHFDGLGTWKDPYERDGWAEPIVRVSNLPSFFKDLPDISTNTSYLYGWLAGYFAADGSVAENGSASISSASREHIEFVMTLCDRLGISHSGHIGTVSRLGMGSEKSDLHRLTIHTGSLTEDFFLVDAHRDRYLAHRQTYKRSRSTRRWTVVAVERTNQVREVFCAVVPTTASFVLVGNILTGNCTAAVVETANDMLSEAGRLGDGQPGALAKKFAANRDSLTKPPKKGFGAPVRPIFGSDSPDPATVAAEKADLVAWALDQVNDHGKPTVTGDKNSYPGNLSDNRTWEAVSVASGDCLGADRCPFSEQCLPRLAREKAADADIVVTNHTLLGVQAANDIPVVIGSKTLGQFDHLFIDEAHGLPSTVRSQGSVEVSSRAVKSVAKTLERTLDDSDKVVKTLLEAAEKVADYVGADLDALGKQTSRKDPVVRLKPGQSPLENADAVLEKWLKQAADVLKKAKKATNSHAAEIALRRAESRVAILLNALELVCEDKPGSARWVEVVTPHGRAADQSMYAVARYTPVDVAPMLRWSLYTRELTDEELEDSGYGVGPTKAQIALINSGGSLGENTAPDGPKPRKPLSVVALSATLPAGFTRQAGLKAQPVAYPSPFDTAYGNSVLFVPRTTAAADIAAVSSNKWGSQKFDTEMHRSWAAQHMVNLVAANGGSALVLAATAASGKVYAETLRKAAAGRWQVLSQWDGVALRRQVEAWKSDTNAVLVGTRSLMTGVDAAGETCTLVIVDRPPRAASNPVDDARVEMLVNDAQMDRYTADRLVYVSDAGELLEQAAGRLIRSINDSGMCAVLDPRLLKSSPFAYKPPVRNAYLDTLHRFEERIADPAAALAWLAERRDTRAAKAMA